MKMTIRLVVAVLVLASSGAAQEATFGLWSAAELRTRSAALATMVGPDHSTRETLADYGHHRFRLLYRDADGLPEQHDAIVDVVMVQSGEGTLQLGGELIGRRAGSGTGEYIGTRLEGGMLHRLGAGDVMHIPAGIPHRFLVPQGQHITYVLVKFPKD